MQTTDTDRPSDQSTVVAAIVHVVGTLFGFVGVTLLYLVTEDVFTKQNAANALNWHVPVSLASIPVVLVGLGVSELAGVALAVTLAGATICFALVATVRAYRGDAWEYPLAPRLVTVDSDQSRPVG
jgi:uncharacterized Tic20 family protein